MPKPENWDEMDKEARKQWRRGKREARIEEGRTLADRAVRVADQMTDGNGEDRAKRAVAVLINLLDAATPFPEPMETVSDLLMRGPLRSLAESQIQAAFDRSRARQLPVGSEESSAPSPAE